MEMNKIDIDEIKNEFEQLINDSFNLKNCHFEYFSKHIDIFKENYSMFLTIDSTGFIIDFGMNVYTNRIVPYDILNKIEELGHTIINFEDIDELEE